MIQHGTVAMIELKQNGNLQGGIRPCVIVSNNKACEVSPVLTVVPLTSKTKRPLPTHVELYPSIESGISMTSTFLAEQITTINRTSIKRVMGVLTSIEIKLIKKAIQKSLAL